jgi:hypothetical protein
LLLHWFFDEGRDPTVQGPDLGAALLQTAPLVSVPAAASSSVNSIDVVSICDTGQADINGEMQSVLQVQYFAWRGQ